MPPRPLPPRTLPPGTLPPGTLPPGTLPPGTLQCAPFQLPTDQEVITLSPSKESEPTVSVGVKIICANEKRGDHKTFILRDIDISQITSLSCLRREMYTQFGSDYIRGCLAPPM